MSVGINTTVLFSLVKLLIIIKMGSAWTKQIKNR